MYYVSFVSGPHTTTLGFWSFSTARNLTEILMAAHNDIVEIKLTDEYSTLIKYDRVCDEWKQTI